MTDTERMRNALSVAAAEYRKEAKRILARDWFDRVELSGVLGKEAQWCDAVARELEVGLMKLEHDALANEVGYSFTRGTE